MGDTIIAARICIQWNENAAPGDVEKKHGAMTAWLMPRTLSSYPATTR
jgi:hypothetical protein